MISFENDYSEGCSPEILEAFLKTNLEQQPGYGEDFYTQRAKEKIAAECRCPRAQVWFVNGGTQTNQLVIDTVLKPHEGVVSVTTGHVNVHEAGAVEYTGRKVLTLPHHQGKMDAGELKKIIEGFYGEGSHSYMILPGMVYISHPTEYGTLYTKEELTALSGVCRSFGIPLYMDGARLGYGLMAEETDVTLPDIAELCDVFYIGGTKVGALSGEAIVFTKNNMPEYFPTLVKQHGALSAKGRLVGLQFDTLFTDGLYYRNGEHGIRMAAKLKEIFREKNCRMYIDSPTNQQFIIMDNDRLRKLSDKIKVSVWEPCDERSMIVRICTSWCTAEKNIDILRELL